MSYKSMIPLLYASSPLLTAPSSPPNCYCPCKRDILLTSLHMADLLTSSCVHHHPVYKLHPDGKCKNPANSTCSCRTVTFKSWISEVEEIFIERQLCWMSMLSGFRGSWNLMWMWAITLHHRWVLKSFLASVKSCLNSSRKKDTLLTLSFIIESWQSLSPRAAVTSSRPMSLAL